MLIRALVRVLMGQRDGRSASAACNVTTDFAARLRSIFPLSDIGRDGRIVTVSGHGRNGYPVTVDFSGPQIVIWFGPGVAEFDDVETAFGFAVMACSQTSRLRVRRDAASLRSWHLETQVDDGMWRPVLGGGHSLGRRVARANGDVEVIMRNERALPQETAPAFDLVAGLLPAPNALSAT